MTCGNKSRGNRPHQSASIGRTRDIPSAITVIHNATSAAPQKPADPCSADDIASAITVHNITRSTGADQATDTSSTTVYVTLSVTTGDQTAIIESDKSSHVNCTGYISRSIAIANCARFIASNQPTNTAVY